MSEATSQIAAVVAVVPGSAQSVLLDEGATVRDALNQTDFSTENMQIRVDGEPANLDTPVVSGARIILSRQVKGNN